MQPIARRAYKAFRVGLAHQRRLFQGESLFVSFAERAPITSCWCRPFASTNQPGKKRPPRKNSKESKTSRIKNDKNSWLDVPRQMLVQETDRVIQSLNHDGGGGGGGTFSSSGLLLDDYFYLLQAWEKEASKTGRIDAAQRAEQLLEALECSHRRQNNNNETKATTNVPAPTLACYKLVLQAYEACGSNNNNNHNRRPQGTVIAERAMATLNFILEEENAKDNDRLRPTTRFYNHVLSCLAKSGVKDAGLQAEAILSKMMTDKTDSSSHDNNTTTGCKPNSKTYTLVLNAWANSGHPYTAERVVEFLQPRLDQYQSEDPQKNSQINNNNNNNNSQLTTVLPLNLAIIHAALDAIVKTIQNKPLRNHHRYHAHDQFTAIEAADQVQSFVEGLSDNTQQSSLPLQQPTAVTFSFALDAWARVEDMDQSGNAAQRAQAILDHMMERYSSHAKYSPRSNNTMADAVKPNTLCFSLVILAWSRAHDYERAEGIYYQLVDFYYKSSTMVDRDTEWTPTAAVGNIVLAAWAKAGNLDRVLMFFQTMNQLALDTGVEECQPNLRSFNILLGSFAKAGKVQEATSLLHWMEGAQPTFVSTGMTLFKRPAGLERPDILSYNSVMSAFAKRGDVSGAEALLSRMKQGSVLPNQVTYTSVLGTYAKSMDPQKVKKAYSLIQEVAMNHKLDAILSVVLIQVCASALPPERKEAFDIASRAFANIDISKKNHVAFLHMATAVNNLLVWNPEEDAVGESKDRSVVEAEKIQLLKALAKQCCESGCLSIAVQKELERCARDSTDTVQAWLKSGSIQSEWSRKVPTHQRPMSSLGSR